MNSIYLLPKEYLPEELLTEYLGEEALDDFRIAPKGHTFIAFEYTLKNQDRAPVEIDERTDIVPDFITLEYNGQTYKMNVFRGLSNFNGEGWDLISTTGSTSLSPGDQISLRCLADIPIEAADLSDTFSIIFRLPRSDGETAAFTYTVTKEDRETLLKMSLN